MEIKANGLNIYAFADTHGMHRKLTIPKNTDLLICAGDVVEDNLDPVAYKDFLDWFDAQPGRQKIFVPGNHELSFAIAPKLAELIFYDRDIILGCNEALIYGGMSFYMMSTTATSTAAEVSGSSSTQHCTATAVNMTNW